MHTPRHRSNSPHTATNDATERGPIDGSNSTLEAASLLSAVVFPSSSPCTTLASGYHYQQIELVSREYSKVSAVQGDAVVVFQRNFFLSSEYGYRPNLHAFVTPTSSTV